MTTNRLSRFDLVSWKIERMLAWRATWTDLDAKAYELLVAEETTLMRLHLV